MSCEAAQPPTDRADVWLHSLGGDEFDEQGHADARGRKLTAQLMVALGVNLTGLTTLPTLREAIESCMRVRERYEGRRAVAEQRHRAT